MYRTDFESCLWAAFQVQGPLPIFYTAICADGSIQENFWIWQSILAGKSDQGSS